MENSVTFEIKSEGKMILKMTSGKELALNNVLYVPKIRKNLVPGLLISKHDFRMVFKTDKIILSKSWFFIDKGCVSYGLYKLNIMTVKKNINKACYSN